MLVLTVILLILLRWLILLVKTQGTVNSLAEGLDLLLVL